MRLETLCTVIRRLAAKCDKLPVFVLVGFGIINYNLVIFGICVSVLVHIMFIILYHVSYKYISYHDQLIYKLPVFVLVRFGILARLAIQFPTIGCFQGLCFYTMLCC